MKGPGLAEDGEFYVDALAGVVLVFDFGLGQGGAAGNAPINRFFAAINETLFHNIAKEAQFVGLVFLVQREIRIVPIAHNAEALELGALELNEFVRVRLAGFADQGESRGSPGGAGRRATLAHFLRHLEFDGQAVAVPAGDVGGAETAQGFVFDDDVLEDLVQGGADVDVAIGEGGAVVQDKFHGRGRGRPGLRHRGRRPAIFAAVAVRGRPGRLSWELGVGQV